MNAVCLGTHTLKIASFRAGLAFDGDSRMRVCKSAENPEHEFGLPTQHLSPARSYSHEWEAHGGVFAKQSLCHHCRTCLIGPVLVRYFPHDLCESWH